MTLFIILIIIIIIAGIINKLIRDLNKEIQSSDLQDENSESDNKDTH